MSFFNGPVSLLSYEFELHVYILTYACVACIVFVVKKLHHSHWLDQLKDVACKRTHASHIQLPKDQLEERSL